MRSTALLFAFMVLLMACQGSKKDKEDGLNLTDAQLKELMKRQPQVGGDLGQGNSVVAQLEIAYQSDSSVIDNVYNLAYHYCNRCLSDSSMQDCPKALQYLGRSIQLQSNYRNGNAYYNRMLCLQRGGQYEAALADLERFIQLNIKNKKPPVNYYYQRAVLYHQLGKISEACIELKNAAKLDTTGLGRLAWKDQCK